MKVFFTPQNLQNILIITLGISTILDIFYEKKDSNGKLKLFAKIWLFIMILTVGISLYVNIETNIQSQRDKDADNLSKLATAIDHIEQKLDADTIKKKNDTIIVITRNIEEKSDQLIDYNVLSEKQKFINANRKLYITSELIKNAPSKLDFNTPSTVSRDSVFEIMSQLVNYLIQLNRSEIDNPVLYKYPSLAKVWQVHLDSMVTYQWVVDGYERPDSYWIRERIIKMNQTITSALLQNVNKADRNPNFIITEIRKNANLPPL